MTSFWLRLLFPKTAQLADYAEELRIARLEREKLIDALLVGRGENPVFRQTEPVRTSSPIIPELTEDPVLQNAMMIEDRRIVESAVANEDDYLDLVDWAAEGRPRAKEMLAEVHAQIEAVRRGRVQ